MYERSLLVQLSKGALTSMSDPARFKLGMLHAVSELHAIYAHALFMQFYLSIWAFWSLPLKSRYMIFHFVNMSSAPPLPPASLKPKPLFFVPPKGSWISAPMVEAFIYTMPVSSSLSATADLFTSCV